MAITWKPTARWLWKEWVRPLGLIVIVLASFRSAAADWYDVPTGSMNPTIMEGDRILVNKLAFGLRVPFTFQWLAQWDEPERGDVVICQSPADGKRLVKRVMGLPGDTVEMRNNVLYINGTAAQYVDLEPNIANAIPPSFHPKYRFSRERLAPADHPVMATPSARAMRSFGPLQVPSGEFFMLGDNRDQSHDSRYFGCVPKREISGRAYATAWSFDPQGFLDPRWGRFFRKLD
jgi:signal peptidase I